MLVYDSDPRAARDSAFVGGDLRHAVVGNRGRLLDARRTPVSITAVMPDRAEFELRIGARSCSPSSASAATSQRSSAIRSCSPGPRRAGAGQSTSSPASRSPRSSGAPTSEVRRPCIERPPSTVRSRNAHRRRSYPARSQRRSPRPISGVARRPRPRSCGASRWDSLDRLLMTFLETRAMNAGFREAEALLIADPDNRAF